MLNHDACEAILDRIVAASGGLDNFAGVDSCATRLRLTFVDISAVRMEALRAGGDVAGILIRGSEYQLVVGIVANQLCRSLRRRIKACSASA